MSKNKTRKQQFLKILLFLLAITLYRLPFTDYQLHAQEQFKYNAKGRRNPFIPLVTSDGRLLKLEKEGDASGLLLEGIIYDKYGRSYAIVNGEIVKIGDAIGDYQVLKIENNKVIFIKEGQPMEVELKKGGE